MHFTALSWVEEALGWTGRTLCSCGPNPATALSCKLPGTRSCAPPVHPGRGPWAISVTELVTATDVSCTRSSQEPEMLEVECAPKGFQIQEPASTNGFAMGHLGVPRYATDADTPAAEDVEVMKQLANDN